MFAQIVSLVTIVAIIACPLWCGDGQCGVAHCCSSEVKTATHDVCSTHGKSDCCCCKESSPAEDEGCPVPEPQDSSCQGVCGGAVLEKPSELPTTDDDCLCLPLTDEQGAIVTAQVEQASTGDDVDAHCGGNYGRLLRALRMSFLL